MSNSIKELVAKVYLNYYVIFEAPQPKEKYLPLIFSEQLANVDGHHLFDEELKGVLPAFWYCLHLPRVSLDVKSLPPNVIIAGRNIPHTIFPVPSYAVNELMLSSQIKSNPPSLIIYEESCSSQAQNLGNNVKPLLGSISVENLRKLSPNEYWKKTLDYNRDLNGEPCLPEIENFQFGEINSDLLTLLFLANQFGYTKSYIELFKNQDYSQIDLMRVGIELHARLHMLSMVGDNIVKMPSDELLKENRKSITIPLTLTMPGLPSRYRKVVGSGSSIPEIELEVLKLLGTHRAIARNGVLYEADAIPDELFHELYKLEDHCREDIQKNHHVWKVLRKIGKILADHLGEDGINSIKRASQITAFTNFPVGLAIIPDTTVPLCCIKQISYKPITPLTRTLQLEFQRTPNHYIGGKCKVLIAECLLEDDRIRPYSDGVWNILSTMSSKNGQMEVVKSDIKTISEMRKFMQSNSDADILVISAHGRYDVERNFAGLVIGKDVWLADEDDLWVPPVVLLSACHVSPRGSGSVNVTDMLLRSGALTVVGTFIPVDVRKNGLLMIRLFTYILEALNGSDQFRTFDEAWKWVVASNAFCEITSTTEKLQEWAYSESNPNGVPVKEFMNKLSRGKLRYSHIYDDTIKIIREMVERDGMLDYLNSVISSQGFFPESVFYQLIGSPENILLYEPVLRNQMKEYSDYN